MNPCQESGFHFCANCGTKIGIEYEKEMHLQNGTTAVSYARLEAELAAKDKEIERLEGIRDDALYALAKADNDDPGLISPREYAELESAYDMLLERAEACGKSFYAERLWAAHLREAIEWILADPYGCSFCDSGKLRNPDKEHGEKCGFAKAVDLIASSAKAEA